MRRRPFLALLASATALPASGCVGGTDPGETPTPEPPAGTLTVRSRECGQDEDRASVSSSGDTVTVTGSITGRDTCDTAALEAVERRDGELHVAIVTQRIDTPETPACAQCLTDIEYEAEITAPGDPSRVIVTHDGETVTQHDP